MKQEKLKKPIFIIPTYLSYLMLIIFAKFDSVVLALKSHSRLKCLWGFGFTQQIKQGTGLGKREYYYYVFHS